MAGKQVTIFHNPRCSKSRATLALLGERGIEPRVVEYLKTPPSVEELRGLLAKLDIGPRELLRTGESAYGELGLDDPSLSEDELIAAIAANPILMQRPVVVCEGRAAIGRPPDQVLAII